MTSLTPARTLGPAVAGVVAIAGALLAPTASAAPAAPAKAKAVQPDDFDGDGYRDVVIGTPFGDVGTIRNAGHAAVLYGSKSGTLHARKQLLDQGRPGVPGTPEPYDGFGAAVSSADLDRDGYADLVVGAPGETAADTGTVSVFWGGKKGLNPAAAVIAGPAGSTIGAHLITGDVNGDGSPDLVTSQSAGVRALLGPFTRNGSPARTTVVAGPGPETPEQLAAGDFNRDGLTDIAATAVRVENDLPRPYLRIWHGSRSAALTAAPDIRRADLGFSAAAGDVNGDGYADLVTGTSETGDERDLPTARNKGGAITWIPGSAKGLVPAKARTLNQSTAGVPGTAERGDAFGSGVSVGRIDSDTYADISLGVPGEDTGGRNEPGAVVVLRGSANGPTGTGARLFGQNTAGVPGTEENADGFGWATKLVDFNRDGRADLIAGAPTEDAADGAVWALKGTASGITAKGSHSFGPRALGLPTGRADFLGAVLNR
ncbi:FG-GAP-like repeat-containing protein [Streptomyces sp. CAU 1734]|uniref:FG-GAP-like repeat-containing protein n=1 Tax=Streptomyces sp. CAU 1734 TaxID=3140360 RepID=UPI003260B9C6